MIRRDASKYSDSISRTSSASRLSLNDVKPVRSANSTDTWRRSTDAAGTAGPGRSGPDRRRRGAGQLGAALQAEPLAGLRGDRSARLAAGSSGVPH